MEEWEKELLLRAQAEQRSNTEFCSTLIGMTGAAATRHAVEHGYSVRSSVVGVGAAFTADMRMDRVNLLLSVAEVVVEADVY